jgi:hypothetical protein
VASVASVEYTTLRTDSILHASLFASSFSVETVGQPTGIGL